MKRFSTVLVLALVTMLVCVSTALAASLEGVRTLSDVETALGTAGIRGNDGTVYIVYASVPQEFVTSKYVRVNTPAHPSAEAPVGTLVPQGSYCTIRLNIENVTAARAAEAIHVDSMDDLKLVATKISDIDSIDDKDVAIVDGQPVIQLWRLNDNGVNKAVFHSPLVVFQGCSYRGWPPYYEFVSDGNPIPLTDSATPGFAVFRTDEARVVVPELYQKILVRELEDAAKLVSWGTVYPVFSADGKSVTTFVETDWAVSPGFVATRVDANGYAVNYREGDMVNRGEIALTKIGDAPANPDNMGGSGGGGCNSGFGILGLIAPLAIAKRRK